MIPDEPAPAEKALALRTSRIDDDGLGPSIRRLVQQRVSPSSIAAILGWRHRIEIDEEEVSAWIAVNAKTIDIPSLGSRFLDDLSKADGYVDAHTQMSWIVGLQWGRVARAVEQERKKDVNMTGTGEELDRLMGYEKAVAALQTAMGILPSARVMTVGPARRQPAASGGSGGVNAQVVLEKLQAEAGMTAEQAYQFLADLVLGNGPRRQLTEIPYEEAEPADDGGAVEAEGAENGAELDRDMEEDGRATA